MYREVHIYMYIELGAQGLRARAQASTRDRACPHTNAQL